MRCLEKLDLDACFCEMMAVYNAPTRGRAWFFELYGSAYVNIWRWLLSKSFSRIRFNAHGLLSVFMNIADNMEIESRTTKISNTLDKFLGDSDILW